MSSREVNAAAWAISQKLGEVTVSPEVRKKMPLVTWNEQYKDVVLRFVLAARADINTNPDRWKSRTD